MWALGRAAHRCMAGRLRWQLPCVTLTLIQPVKKKCTPFFLLGTSCFFSFFNGKPGEGGWKHTATRSSVCTCCGSLCVCQPVYDRELRSDQCVTYSEHPAVPGSGKLGLTRLPASRQHDRRRPGSLGAPTAASVAPCCQQRAREVAADAAVYKRAPSRAPHTRGKPSPCKGPFLILPMAQYGWAPRGTTWPHGGVSLC